MMIKSESVPESRPVRVGLIGCGKMGLQHLKAINKLPDVQVVGVADPAASPDSMEGLLPTGARIVPDAATLLRELTPDVVHIVTPPGSHAALASQAIAAGCHVYVEKPFTPTRQEAETLLAEAAARGVTVCAGHQVLYERPAILAREHLATIGDLVHIESFFSFRMVRRTITAADQAKDILPHAVYPLVEQLRLGTGLIDEPFTIQGVDVRPSGDVYALLRLGNATGIVVVTLNGRPIEQYQKILGTNGSLRADYITGSLTQLTGPGTGPGVLFTPYRRAWQTLTGATAGFTRLIVRGTSYAGLATLIGQFYDSIRGKAPLPITPQSIVDTVDVCERIGIELDEAEAAAEAVAARRLAEAEAALPPLDPARGVVLVTGGTGLLGKPVVAELRGAGYAVRCVTRRVPRLTARVPGVEYVAADLGAGELPDTYFAGVTKVAHCAAETAGGKEDHQRNSIAATEYLVRAAARHGVQAFIQVSSLAVLKPGRGRSVDEQSPLDAGNLERGPYVWGKAESEILAIRLGQELRLPVKVIRPGPLVDYTHFHPPGRLGRELGPYYVAIGGRRTPLSVCDVATAAQVVRWYLDHFNEAPPVLNMVEAPSQTRAELVARLKRDRPDLRVYWFPGWLLRLLSPPAKLAQRLLLGAAKPLDVYAAFSSERYRTDVAAATIASAQGRPARG